MSIINYTVNEMEEAKKSGFEPLPAGVYDGFIADVEDRTGKNGTNYTNITVQVKWDGRDRQLFDAWFLDSEKGRPMALRKIGQLVAIAGLPEDGKVETENFRGMDVRVKVGCKMDEYRGEMRNNIRDYLTPKEGAGATLPFAQDDSVPF